MRGSRRGGIGKKLMRMEDVGDASFVDVGVRVRARAADGEVLDLVEGESATSEREAETRGLKDRTRD
jgi:hypothetical protein